MKPIFLLLCMSLAPLAIHAQQYKHKSEAEIAAMTPEQRVDEHANEQAFHKYDLLDTQHELLLKYILQDGLKALPRIIGIMDEYDPTTAGGKANYKGERFDAMWMLLNDLDNRVTRLRASSAGIGALDSLTRALDRMRAAGYGRKDQHEWAEHGRFDLASMTLNDARGLNATDNAIRDTLRIKYRIRLSNRQLLAFTKYLVERDATYPNWSGKDLFEDYSRKNSAGNPAQVYVLKKPDRFYQAYLEFKKQNT